MDTYIIEVRGSKGNIRSRVDVNVDRRFQGSGRSPRCLGSAEGKDGNQHRSLRSTTGLRALFAELENETRRESKLKPPYLQKTDQFSCLNFALEWHRYSRARGKSIDISQHLLELENQVLAWRQLAEPTTADELFTPFEDVLSINKTTYGEPRHGLDLARDLLLNVDIRGIQLHVDPHILSSWKSDGTIANFLCNWAIWERIILSSQFESPQIADNALAECRMDWDKSWSSNKERWDDFLRRFTIVANMSTMIELNTTQLYCFEARDILKYFAHNIGIRIIRSDTKIFFKDKASFAQLSTVEVFKDLKDRYLNWCSQNIQRQNVRPQYISDARFLDTTRPSTPPITESGAPYLHNASVPRYNKLKNFRPSFDSDSDSDVRNRNPEKNLINVDNSKVPEVPVRIAKSPSTETQDLNQYVSTAKSLAIQSKCAPIPTAEYPL
ncbi:hypothetical protein GEMRC1_001866 [Eukaryota sp. GEM-RC1]